MAEMIKEYIAFVIVIPIVGIFIFPFFFGRWCPPVVRARGKLAELIWSTKNGFIFGVILTVVFFVLVLTGIVNLK